MGPRFDHTDGDFAYDIGGGMMMDSNGGLMQDVGGGMAMDMNTGELHIMGNNPDNNNSLFDNNQSW